MVEDLKQILRGVRNRIVFGARAEHDRVSFSGVGTIFVNRSDNRGNAIVKAFGTTQPRTTKIWHQLARSLRPTLVVDVGANHGEISLSTIYSEDASVILFEPNAALHPVLRMSIASHHNGSKICLDGSIASDSEAATDFFVDESWSGTSSAVKPDSYRDDLAGQITRLHIRSTTIDSAVASRTLDAKRVLFKIDVEGFEGRVIDGFLETLGRADAFAGVLEFDKNFLLKAGTDPAKFLRTLKSLGTVGTYNTGTFRQVDELESLNEHTDLLVSSRREFLRCADRSYSFRLLFRS